MISISSFPCQGNYFQGYSFFDLTRETDRISIDLPSRRQEYPKVKAGLPEFDRLMVRGWGGSLAPKEDEMHIELKRWNVDIIFSGEAESLREVVEKNRAYLEGANLRGANLRGATYGEGIPLTLEPLGLSGLKYFVIILDTHLKIGCELHSFEEWQEKGDAIARKHGETDWWNHYKEAIFALIKAVRRSLISSPGRT